jgi:hypothetical protein
MLIPMELLLGLACTFYVLVAIRWFRESLVIRRQNKHATSAIVPGFVPSYGLHLVAREKVNQGREVIVMRPSVVGKHQKQVGA